MGILQVNVVCLQCDFRLHLASSLIFFSTILPCTSGFQRGNTLKQASLHVIAGFGMNGIKAGFKVCSKLHTNFAAVICCKFQTGVPL